MQLTAPVMFRQGPRTKRKEKKRQLVYLKNRCCCNTPRTNGLGGSVTLPKRITDFIENNKTKFKKHPAHLLDSG